MKRTCLATGFSLLAFLAQAPARAQIAVPPYWFLTQGTASTCSDDDVFLGNVFINVPAPLFVSERGVLSAPGLPELGFTVDSNFQGVGVFGFTVFTDPYVVPANTPLTLVVRTYEQPNFQGRIAYLSTVTWDCTTGALLSAYAGPASIFEDGVECGSTCNWSAALPLEAPGSPAGAWVDSASPPASTGASSTSTRAD